MIHCRAAHRSLFALLFAALLAFLPGCQWWNAYLDALKWKTDPKSPTQRNVLTVSDIPSQSGIKTPALSPGMIPRVTVYRITMPIGTFSGNDRVWAQLNQDAIDAKTTILMAQNGMRAAIGELTRWPLIAKLLDGPGATSDQILYQTDGRSSINVITRPGVTDQYVFSIDRDSQQQGRMFERCDNGFRLAMRSVRNKPELQVQLEPIVHLGTVAIVRPGLGITQSEFTSEETFDDLRMTTTLTSEQFLVISAMDPKANEFSIGTLWLSDRAKVPATETILVFVPTPMAQPVAPR